MKLSDFMSIEKNTYVVIDFETTGLKYKTDQVIEMAAIKLDEDFNEVGSFHTFIENYLPLPEIIKQLTGITEEDLKYGLGESDAFDIFRKFIGSSTVVAQYAPFDLAFLFKQGITPSNYICTKSLTAQVEPNESSSLGPTCERLGIELKNAHRAIDDARATGKVLAHRLKNNDGSLSVLNTLVVAEGRPLNYIPKSTAKILTKTGALVADFGGRVK